MLEKKALEARDAGGDGPPGRRRRADRASETRRKLIDAAAGLVGAEGYANASVAKITARSEIAQGTFYNYFASQQDLFNQLLPELGTELLDFIRARIAGEEGSFSREEIGFRAYFDFLAERPEFYRILNEAETFAPKAFHDHMRNMAEGYARALSRSHAKGELPGYAPRELEVIIYAMLAARNYLSYRYLFRDGRPRRLPAWIDRAYMKLITGGMSYGGTTDRPRRSRRIEPSADSAVVSDAIQFRSTASEPGETHVELEVTPTCLGDDGTIRRGVVLQLIEAAATAGASHLSGTSPRLLSLSTAFLKPLGSEDVAAVASVHGNEGTVHVTVEVHAVSDAARPIATAQAVYTTGTSPDVRGYKNES